MTGAEKNKLIHEQIEIIRSAMTKLWLAICTKESDAPKCPICEACRKASAEG